MKLSELRERVGEAGTVEITPPDGKKFDLPLRVPDEAAVEAVSDKIESMVSGKKKVPVGRMAGIVKLAIVACADTDEPMTVEDAALLMAAGGGVMSPLGRRCVELCGFGDLFSGDPTAKGSRGSAT